jgi:hypothetical protein
MKTILITVLILTMAVQVRANALTDADVLIDVVFHVKQSFKYSTIAYNDKSEEYRDCMAIQIEDDNCYPELLALRDAYIRLYEAKASADTVFDLMHPDPDKFTF